MPARTIKHHDDLVVGVARAHLIEKQLHARGIDVRQDQRIEFPAFGLHGRVGVGVLVGQHRLA